MGALASDPRRSRRRGAAVADHLAGDL